jgi:Leucine-rich repeat (LRR) protein
MIERTVPLIVLFGVSPAVGLAIVAAIVIGGLWLLRKLFSSRTVSQESESPFAVMFRQNEEAAEEQRRQVVSALDKNDPLREWVKRGGRLGWIGFAGEMLLSLDTREGLSEPVRSLSFPGLDPNLRGLPPISEPFGVDFAHSVCSDRTLKELASHRNLVVLNLGWETISNSSAKIIAQMADLRMLALSNTSITGAGVAQLTQLPNLQFLDLRYFSDLPGACPHVGQMKQLTTLLMGSGLVDDGLRELRGLTQLTLLDLYMSGVSDRGLVHLRPLSRLQNLNLSLTAMTDAGLRHLGELPSLKTLRLNSLGENLTGSGLEGLRNLVNLEQLELRDNAISGDALRHLAELPNLRELDLTGTRIDDSTVRHLALFPRLRVLKLAKTRISDDGMRHLSRLSELTHLDLTDLAITDGSVAELQKFGNLRYLNLFGTKLTMQGAENVANALPAGGTIQTSFPK